MLDDRDIYAEGVDVTTGPPPDRDGVPRSPTRSPPCRSSTTWAAGLEAHGHARREHARTRARALRAVGLWEEVKGRLNSPGVGLSGGQQQRLCIARTIASSPR